MFDTDIFYIYI